MMYFRILTVACLFRLVYGAQMVKGRTEPDSTLSSVFAQISSFGASLLPPSSLIPDLREIPASIVTIIFHQSYQSVLHDQIQSGASPSWFLSLSPAAQEYILSIYGKERDIVPKIVAIEKNAGFSSLILPTAPAVADARTTAESRVSTSTVLPDFAAARLQNNITSIIPTTTSASVPSKLLDDTASLITSMVPDKARASSTVQAVVSNTNEGGAAQSTGVNRLAILGVAAIFGLAMVL